VTEIHRARSDDHGRAVELLDAAMLEADADRLRDRIDRGGVLVAEADGRVVGVCVLADRDAATEITQIAVHRSRRARGVGRRLVEAAAAEADGPLTATFRRQVRPFYESLGFEIAPATEGADGAGDGGDDADGDSGGDDDRGGDEPDDRGRFRGVLR
jgi:N-acetylglutamate synthase-like GNAT family acetyltransferase